MFSHYLNVAFRQLKKRSLIAGVNILGLAVGLAACLTLMIYVKSELTHDLNWQDGENLSMVVLKTQRPGMKPRLMGFSDGTIKPLVDTTIGSEIEGSARLMLERGILANELQGKTLRLGLGSDNILDVLRPEILLDATTRSLEDPSHIWLSQSTAQSLFGKEDARGLELTFDDGRSLKVVGIFKDLPRKSHVDFDALRLLQNRDVFKDGEAEIDTAEGYMAYTTYIRTAGPNGLDGFEDRLSRAAVERSPDSEWLPEGADPIKLFPIRSVHTTPDLYVYGAPTDPQQLVIFSLLALIILVIAAVNFMNMSVVRVTARARETAMRRVLGAKAGSVITQFLSETGLYIFFSLALSLVLVELSLPALSSMVGVDLALVSIVDPVFLILCAAMIGLAILLSGAYPAVLAARMRPAETLGAGLSVPIWIMRLSQGLLVVQFTAAIVLIALTVLLNAQMGHMANLDRGFDRDNILTVRYLSHEDVAPSRDSFRDEILRLPNVTNAAFSWTTPGFSERSVFTTDVVNGEQVPAVSFTGRYISPDYFDLLRIKLLAGRNFIPGAAEDLRAEPVGDDIDPATFKGGNILVSMLGAKQMGFDTPDAALGGTVVVGQANATVIGVVDDIFVDAKEIGREPTVYLYDPENYSRLNIRFTGDPRAARDAIKTIWERRYPAVPFQSDFLDDVILERYADTELQKDLLTLFAGLAVFVSLMGLFGISAYHASRKQKEVSLRKLFGASIPRILGLLALQFTRPVMIACVLAWPLIFVWGRQWLQGFTERIDFSGVMFVGPSVLTLLLALFIVSVNALRVARMAPIRTLRHE